MTYTSTQFNEMIKNLDADKIYHRQLDFNGKKYPHKTGFKCDDDSGYYKDGIEVFKFKHNKYILRSYSTWSGEVMISNEIRFNKDKKILKTMVNLFGLSNKELIPFSASEGLLNLDEFLQGILCDWVDDEDRMCIIKK